MTTPERGELWYANLDPVRGHEQAGHRPVLIISATQFNQGPAGLAIVVPLTTRDRGIYYHVAIEPDEGGVSRQSMIKCEDLRSIDQRRLTRRLGAVADSTMAAVEKKLRALLVLHD
ncbi:MAG: type II toxin-antitoxin system PemK/MazF family toxin [Armatimonadia bacterium]|nr:type II toxin-antitoxin system PemK/MazF family toxin [Armatimonadia bacterium]